jgi:predicted PurR-regulated permease PerM
MILGDDGIYSRNVSPSVMNEKRLVVAVFGVAIAVTVGYIAYRFVAPLTVSVFLYYSTRRYHKSLGRFRLPVRVRAGIVLASVVVPLVLLVSYTLVLLVVESRRFVNEYALVDLASTRFEWLAGLEEIPAFTVQGVYGAYRAGELDVFIDFATRNATVVTDLVSSFFLNLFVVVIVTYYLLVDGARIREWLLRFDDDAIVREYLEAVDSELEAVLFGNLLNVIATSLIAIVVYQGYNVIAPPEATLAYPTLAGALTGLASLIPIVGMKVIYLPLALVTALPLVLAGSYGPLGYVAGFLVAAVVVVDTIPDLVLRPLLSGKTTHVGLLMLAYTLGPVVLGFYGFFFAPILLVIGLTFADTALPRLLGAENPMPRSVSPESETTRETPVGAHAAETEPGA